MSSVHSVLLSPGTVVIGDLHLDLFDEGHSSPFALWCSALDAPRLIILGDLFEFWVGRNQLRVPGARKVIGAMAELASRGTAVEVLMGNRDFLLDRHFEQASGARVHSQGLLGEHDGGPTLFLHGDELCTLDVGYQRFKRVVRSTGFRWLATHLPFVLQRGVAGRLRSQSVRSVASKPQPTKAMQPQAADAFARTHGASALVCGHAHVYREDELACGARWSVIDGWGGSRDALVLGEDGRWVGCSAASLVA